MIVKTNNIISSLAVIIFFMFHAQFLYGEDWWRVYFTTPGVKNSSVETPEKALIRNIRDTKASFYGAFYEINSDSIVRELIKARKRGIDVKLVIEKDNYKKTAVKELIRAGINVVTDNRRALMHNKFAVIDGRILWTGSYNLTYNGEYKNNNNVIEINSKDLADIYLSEFKEMFEKKIFGNRKEYTVFPLLKKKYHVKIEGTNINAYFSPEDNIERIIIQRLGKAKESVYFMAFSFTSDKIADEMIRLKNKGIKICGVIEKIGSKTKDSEYTKFKLENMLVKTDRNKYRMHHKFIIIDKKIIISGSYNFSANANRRNDENIVIINNKNIALKFFEEFLKNF